MVQADQVTSLQDFKSAFANSIQYIYNGQRNKRRNRVDDINYSKHMRTLSLPAVSQNETNI